MTAIAINCERQEYIWNYIYNSHIPSLCIIRSSLCSEFGNYNTKIVSRSLGLPQQCDILNKRHQVLPIPGNDGIMFISSPGITLTPPEKWACLSLWRPINLLVTSYRIAGNFCEVKNRSTRKTVVFVSKNFPLPALHSYVPVSHAYVKISWRASLPTKITNIYPTKITRYTV